MRKEPAADNIISWAVKFEEKKFSGVQTFEALATTWLPEIHFVNLWQRREKGEPIKISNSNKSFQEPSRG